MRLPAIKLDYLDFFTDDTGVFQHGRHCIPKRAEGYTTDDNARALVAVTLYNKIKNDKKIKKLANTYLSFLNFMQKPDGSFHNYLGYDRRYLDVDGSDECLGRALWACGCTINSSLPTDSKLVAKEIFGKALPSVYRSISLRAFSTTLLGLYNCYCDKPEQSLFENTEKLADLLLRQYKNEAKDDWRWFESHLTYDNARLPQALFNAYMITKKPFYLDTARESLDFLLKTQIIDEKFVPIGNKGWYTYGGERPIYDQQPLEAAALVDAAADAFMATQEQRYLEVAPLAFEWFLGRNTRNQVMYNPETCGCFDGLSEDSVNQNQGAESSISYLMARLKLEELQKFSGDQPVEEAAVVEVF